MLNQFKRKHKILMIISSILVLASIWILSLNNSNDANAGRNADMWITNSFWEQKPSDGNIIAALFGNGTPGSSPYNRYWDGFCLPNKITYVHNTAQIQNMVRDTIYVVEDGFYYISSDIIPANCSAIIGKGTGEVIFSGAGVSIMNKSNVILDNLIIEGDNIILNNTHHSTINNVEVKNIDEGIQLYNSSNNRLNRIKSHDNNYGIKINKGSKNFISECELFNNNEGISLESTWDNIINNCQIYNNISGIKIYNNYTTGHNSINNTQVYNNEIGLYIDSSKKNVINNSHIYSNIVGIKSSGDIENLLMSGNIYNNDTAFSSINNSQIRYYNTIGLFGNTNDNIGTIFKKGGYEDEANYDSQTDLLILLNPGVGRFDTDVTIDRFFRTYPVDHKGVKFITPLSDFMRGNLDWIPEIPIKYIAGKKIIKQVRPLWFAVANDNTWGVLLHEHNPNYFIASIDSETSELDDSIINYYYGNYTRDSEFTKNWNEKNCNINVMTVEYINNQTEFHDKLLSDYMPLGHTIYVLGDGEYNVTDTISVGNDCTAIVNYKGSGALLTYYPGNQSLYAMIYVDGHENLIFDNLALDGDNNTNSNLFLDRYESIASQNSTINYIQSFNSLGDGIQLGMLANYNTIMNSQVWNNKGYGVELFLAGEHNVINNSLSYNNNLYGLRFGNKSRFNSINNSQFFNNGIGGIFSDLNTESNIINNVHVYNNTNFGLNFKWSSGNTLNHIYSYNNNVGINIEDDSAVNNIYISNMYIFANKESNLRGTNGNDEFLDSDYIYIPGLNSEDPNISDSGENTGTQTQDNLEVNLVADLSGGIGVDSTNTSNEEDNTKSLETSETNNIEELSNNYNEAGEGEEEDWDTYTAAAMVLSGYYFNGNDVSSWTESYNKACTGKMHVFFDSTFLFGDKLCTPGAKSYTDEDLIISGVVISGVKKDNDCEYKILNNFVLTFQSNKELTGLSINVGDLEIEMSSEDWYITGGIILSGDGSVISSGNYVYSGIFVKPDAGSGYLNINFTNGSNTGKAILDEFYVVFTDAVANEDTFYTDLRSDFGFEVKNKTIYLQDNSIFILDDDKIKIEYPIHIGKCSAIIGQTDSVLYTEKTGVEIINFDNNSTYSIIDHVGFKIGDGLSDKTLGFNGDPDFYKYYTIINKSTVNGTLIDDFDSNMSYADPLKQLPNYVKFLPKKPGGTSGDIAELPDVKWDIITGLDMSCQYVTNIGKAGANNGFFFENGVCDSMGTIPTWITHLDYNNLFYIFGQGISKQIVPVGYNDIKDEVKMVGLSNQYINTSYIGETNPILYTNPGSIIFSGAFKNNIDTGINYEINVQFTNQGIINHNFDIILTITTPEDIDGHLEIKRGGNRENVGSGITDVNYKELEDMRIVVKTPEDYLQEIEGTLYIGTEEYGNNFEVFWIQTIADPTPPSIVWMKNINNGGVWGNLDNIWQVKTDGKYTVKSWYDYVDSPSDCNSGINMNEYTNMKEMNLKDYDNGAETLNGKYVCIYAKDIVSNVVSTAVSNKISISMVNFVDDIIPGPSYYDSVSVSFENVYNYGYNWVINKGRCNEQNTNGLNWIPYDGNFILNTDRYNNKYMCIKAEDSLGNKQYFASANSANIVGRGDMVYFEDGVNPSWNNEDIVSIGFSDEVEFAEKSYKWVSNILDCTDTGGMISYSKSITIDNQYLNGYYFCLYTLESGSNIENYLISPTSLKVDVTNPTTPIILSPKDGDILSYLVIELTGAYDSDAGLAGYEYQISEDISFMELTDYGFSAVSGNLFIPKFDGKSGIYYIKIRSIDNAGNISDTRDNIGYIQFEYNLFSGFEFDDITGADLGKKYQSNVITMQGIPESGEVYVEVTNGVLFRNGVAKGSGAMVKNGDTISIGMVSSDKYDTKAISNLIVLNKIIPWTILTKPQDPISKKYDISDEDMEDVLKIFDNMVQMYSDEGERIEMFYTMKGILKDEIDLNVGHTGKLKYLLYLIENYLNDDSENGGKIHTAPNCKKYEIAYDAKKDGYYSPDMMVINGKTSYFATITDLLRYIDSKNSGGECGYHIYRKIHKHNPSSAVRHISPSGKLYDIEYTKLGYTSPDLATTKYFASVYDLKSYINKNNPAVNLLTWDHTVDTEFSPVTYTAPNGKSYVIYHTDKGYMSYKFMSVKYFESLDEMEVYIDKNNKK